MLSEYARQHNRKKVTCFTKDNIMKQTDGLFHQVFDEIAKEYPDLENEHWIIDIGAAKMADTPEAFDVIVMPNLYGDVLSDVAAQITGSVGLAGSANIGEECAMFEAIHGSAPRRAGQNVANPSGLLQGAIAMLNYIGQTKVAEKVQNAWLKTIEDGTHTYDIYKEGVSKQQVGTKEFAQAVIANLGSKTVDPQGRGVREQRHAASSKYQRKPAAKRNSSARMSSYTGRVTIPTNWRNSSSRSRPRDQALDDHQPRHQGVARRIQGNLLYGPLALPLQTGRRRTVRQESHT